MTVPDSTRDPDFVSELLRRAAELEAEASAVVTRLDLLGMLSVLGELELIGSAVSGLMVWRDIDISVRCRDLTPARFWTALRPLLADPGLTRLDYRNETGERCPSGDPADERLYAVIRYETEPVTEWKIDLSLWDSDAPRPYRAEAEALRRLDDETRLAVLWIKDVWCRLPVYPYEVSGYEVYDAVLGHGVRTPEGFDAYLRERGLPGRE
jgi:hypothetical protein